MLDSGAAGVLKASFGAHCENFKLQKSNSKLRAFFEVWGLKFGICGS
jgi:hypothetical protein